MSIDKMLGAVAQRKEQMKFYVASSWRNVIQPGVVRLLRKNDFEVYDFREPMVGNNGFHWSEIDPNWQDWSPKQFKKFLSNPIAQKGFNADFTAMKQCDAAILVMPCGRSAHLELGYFIGTGKPTAICLSDGEPELMYCLADKLSLNMDELLNWCKSLGEAPTKEK